MILVDANILLYAEDALSAQHERTRNWWDNQLSGTDPVCLCWTVICAYIRIGTNPRVFKQPLTLEQAQNRVTSWLARPNVHIIKSTEAYWKVFRQTLTDGQATANLVTDAHLAALAIEHGCVLASADSDFARFKKLKWINPTVA